MNSKHISVFAMLAGLSIQATAGVDGDAVVGGALGGAAGAAVGSALGGRDAAIVGGGLGGALGTAIATKDQKREIKKEVVVQKEVVYVEREGRHDNGLHRGHYKKHKKHRHDD